ncbi:hypothetical protein KJK34_07140 [Flavobacterium sp. D11R37]|uniref:hypothetical protein n=1 Tax=Flavobacterium coralii TaxID=2838017 RepID=UPI001CA65645|nr:hypothetical protein [Flavobacterium coralii]MBY8962524.1 hypothetical protein [Flavobacterium coralii]
MKKIITLFAMILAFGYTANAQQKKVAAAPVAATQTQQNNDDATTKAAADITALHELVQLTPAQKADLTKLFVQKHKYLATPDFSQQRKDILAEQMEMNVKAALTPEQLTKLEKNPKLITKLTH